MENVTSETDKRDFASLPNLRTDHSSEFLIGHLNINSYQNKFEEMKEIVLKLRIQVMMISETAIDSSYPDSQFAIPGYMIYRSDRNKGVGGILVYVSSRVICKRVKVPRCYKTIESLVLEIRLKRGSVIVAGLYRPQKPLVSNYQQQFEEDINHLCYWVSLQRQAVVMLGDLNLDRLRPDRAEGKLLIDKEETHGFECLITQPTRIQTRDVILTNQPNLFIHSGVYDPGLSDHPLVYGFVQEKEPKCKARVIKFRSTKNLNEDDFKNHLRCALWHVGEVFDDVEDQVVF